MWTSRCRKPIFIIKGKQFDFLTLLLIILETHSLHFVRITDKNVNLHTKSHTTHINSTNSYTTQNHNAILNFKFT
jgi:hypothetical protein